MITRAKIAWVGIIAGAALLGSDALVFAASESGNPYSVIVERNVFRLNPPPPPVVVSNGPPPDLPVINLAGFIRVADDWKVLLAVKVKSGGGATPEDISYLTMAEGDKEGVVELLKVYPDQEKVDVNNSGTPMTLTMKDNGFQGAPAPAPAGPRGAGPGLIRQIGAPAAQPPGVSSTVPLPAVTGQFAGAGAGAGGENNTLVGGSAYNRGAVATPAVFPGATVNPGVQQQQQVAYSSIGYSGRTGGQIITGGAAAPTPPAQAPLTLPIGQNGNLSHLTQPNSTPPMSQATDVPMPPVPGL